MKVFILTVEGADLTAEAINRILFNNLDDEYSLTVQEIVGAELDTLEGKE